MGEAHVDDGTDKDEEVVDRKGTPDGAEGGKRQLAFAGTDGGMAEGLPENDRDEEAGDSAPPTAFQAEAADEERVKGGADGHAEGARADEDRHPAAGVAWEADGGVGGGLGVEGGDASSAEQNHGEEPGIAGGPSEERDEDTGDGGGEDGEHPGGIAVREDAVEGLEERGGED